MKAAEEIHRNDINIQYATVFGKHFFKEIIGEFAIKVNAILDSYEYKGSDFICNPVKCSRLFTAKIYQERGMDSEARDIVNTIMLSEDKNEWPGQEKNINVCKEQVEMGKEYNLKSYTKEMQFETLKYMICCYMYPGFLIDKIKLEKDIQEWKELLKEEVNIVAK